MGRFLIGLGGKEPSDGRLADVMLEFSGLRQALLAARGTVPARAFSEAIVRFPREPLVAPGETESTPGPHAPRLALVGGPLSAEDFTLFDMIVEAGGRVVLDGAETGERTMPAPFDGARTEEDPLAELVRAYFGSIPDVSRRPNSGLYGWLNGEIGRRKVQGVVLVRWAWCDLWHAEVARFRERLPVPVLEIDLNGEDMVVRNRTRVQAFMEALR